MVIAELSFDNFRSSPGVRPVQVLAVGPSGGRTWAVSLQDLTKQNTLGTKILCYSVTVLGELVSNYSGMYHRDTIHQYATYKETPHERGQIHR